MKLCEFYANNRKQLQNLIINLKVDGVSVHKRFNTETDGIYLDREIEQYNINKSGTMEIRLKSQQDKDKINVRQMLKYLINVSQIKILIVYKGEDLLDVVKVDIGNLTRLDTFLDNSIEDFRIVDDYMWIRIK